MSEVKRKLTDLIIFTFPFMTIFTFSNGAKFNLALSDFFIILLGIAILIDIRNFKIKRDFPYWWYTVGLVLIMIISNFINKVSLSTTISEGIKFIIAGVYLFVGYSYIRHENIFKNILRIWLVGTWINIIVGLYIQINAFMGNHINVNNALSPRTRFMGLLTDANLAATYLTISFFIAIIFYKLSSSYREKVVSILTMLFTALCIFLTQSRGGLVGFIVGLIVYFIFNYKKTYKIILMILPLILIIYFGFIDVDYTFLNGSLSNQITDRIEEAAKGEGQFLIRKNLSLASIMMGLDHPIIGVGRGNFVNNSKPYIDKIYDRSDDFVYKESIRHIPHNTFAGIFAELGIIGLIMFSSLFYIVFKKVRKSNYQLKDIILSMAIAFFVQSLVLSLENFRGLWILMGLFINMDDYKIEIKERDELELGKRKLISYVLISVAILIPLYFDVGRKIQEVIKLNDRPYTVFIDNVVDNEIYNLKYNITSKSNSSGNISCKVNVYAVTNNSEELIDSYEYWTADGIGKLTLKGDKNVDKYKVEFVGTNNEGTKALVTDIRYETDNKVVPLNKFKYIPDFIAKKLGKMNLLYYMETNYKLPVQVERIVFSNKIQYLGSNIEEKNGNAYIKLKFKALEKLENDYILDIEAFTDNINNCPYAYGNKNKFSNKILIKPKTSTWEVGKIYEVVYTFKGEKNTVYDLSFTILDKKRKPISNKKIYLGKVKTNSYSLADYLNNIKENQVVIISVKDEGSRAIDPETINALNKLGFKQDIRGKFRFSYVGVGGKVSGLDSFEILQWEKISKKFIKGDRLGDFILPFDLEVVSAGYTEGNISSIKINGKEYSKNKRGMNIVVYDLYKNEVVDSVNFDTCLSIFR